MSSRIDFDQMMSDLYRWRHEDDEFMSDWEKAVGDYLEHGEKGE